LTGAADAASDQKQERLMPEHRRAHRRSCFLAALVAVAAVAGGGCPPGPGGGAAPDAVAEIGDGRPSSLDDLWYSAERDELLVGVGNRGWVSVVTRVDAQSRSFPGLFEPLSVVDGNGHLYVIERSTSTLAVLDGVTGEIVGRTVLSGSPDYVRYAAGRSEIWVSEPGANRIEILQEPSSAPFNPQHVAFADTGGGAEGIALNEARDQAYTHLSGGKLGVISISTRAVLDRWSTGCFGLHGIPRFDEARGLVFAGCSGSAEVVALRLADGSEAGRHKGVGGTTILAYAPALGHFYLRGDPGVPVQALGVSAAGTFTVLGTFDAATNGHCAAADDQGALWVCDADSGRLLRFTDPFAPTP